MNGESSGLSIGCQFGVSMVTVRCEVMVLQRAMAVIKLLGAERMSYDRLCGPGCCASSLVAFGTQPPTRWWLLYPAADSGNFQY